ncbi:uncharacterized protein LOC117653184 isoform X4 [Thrips palmi]|uniref:Uncharacterized protein LOC117653184 isoform X4 n=1 Tax=Thrips palmi TaxID=161013 RepID=A0A6P9AAN9_THRPL|nr:uncharacterized protein LOC117653184 isoform X4 [Thrips palmi]
MHAYTRVTDGICEVLSISGMRSYVSSVQQSRHRFILRGPHSRLRALSQGDFILDHCRNLTVMESLRKSPKAAADGQTMAKEEVPSQGPNEETSLLSLPDDDLLSVLEYLSTPDLLSCRAVCHRLRDVALRPELWRRRSFGFGQGDLSTRSLQAAVLRLAPCASRLSMRFEGDSDALGTLAATTRCAAVELMLEVDDDPARLDAAKLAIRNQAALGMLRTLQVYMEVYRTNDGHVFADLLAEAFSTQGLTRLVVVVLAIMEWPVGAGPAPPIPASIKEVALTDVDPRFVHCVLRSHAATLQAVQLWGDCQGVAPLLAAIPGLQRLECPVMEDLPLVAKCASLRSLNLTVKDCKDSAVEAASQATAAAFLRAATHLEELQLRTQRPPRDGAGLGSAGTTRPGVAHPVQRGVLARPGLHSRRQDAPSSRPQHSRILPDDRDLVRARRHARAGRVPRPRQLQPLLPGREKQFVRGGAAVRALRQGLPRRALANW